MSNKRFNQPYGVTIGQPLARPNRNVATPDVAPAQVIATAPAGGGERNAEIYTLFTKVGQQQPNGTPILYNNERQWARITVTLETAGPVAVGTRADLFPVLSGRGVLLATGVPTVFNMGKGQNRLYYAATAVSRLKVEIEAFPWLEEINANVVAIRDLLAGRK